LPVKTPLTFVALMTTLILSAATPLLAQVQLLAVVSGLSSPVFAGHAGDGSNRLFIVEKSGVIKVLQPGSSTPTVFLDIHTRVLSTGGEQGLLGLAFHPSYESNGRFFVYYTRSGGEIVLAEYHVSANPNVAGTGETILLTIPHPSFTNHNGGMLAFDHDNYLRAGVGDGGSGNDPTNNAQNLGTLLGKILRIDVDPAPGTDPYAVPATNPFIGAPGARPEIFAYGMRNPWRFSFDRLTNDQWVADVGQGAREEVDTPIVNGGNYGWRVFEGFSCTGVDPGLCGGSGYIAPLFEYTHTGGRCSITGGYVYRGNQNAVAGGTYIYGDYCTGEIFGWNGANQNLLLDTALNIASFGEDESGELYVVGLGGTVHKIVSTSLTGTELLSNGDFSAGAANWQQFATPNPSNIDWNVAGGVFSFYRVAAEGQPNQAVVFQHTGWALLPGSPITASFDIGNTSTVRKRISVLIVDSDFSDLAVCTFWLPPNSPLRTYGMRTHTTEAWTNAAIYFYAATTGSDGGGYSIDNVTMRYQDDVSDTRTECVDPTAPNAQGTSAGPNLIANGSFNSGLAAWSVFGQLAQQLAGGVVEFYRPLSADPAGGGLLQQTGTAIQSGQILTAHFDLGNSSPVRKRITVLLHDLDFSDLSACTFWLAPGQPLSTYEMRSFTTEAWSNVTISLYAATVGNEQWTRLDNVTLQHTPAAAIAGTECIESGDAGGANFQAVVPSQQLRSPSRSVNSRQTPTPPNVISVVTAHQSTSLYETTLILEGGTEGSVLITLPPDPCRSTATLEISVENGDWRSIASTDSAGSPEFRITLSSLRTAAMRLRVISERLTACSGEHERTEVPEQIQASRFARWARQP